jgi:hypothetical protein
MISTFSNLKNLHLECRDGTIGRVKDLFFDDEAWTIRYLVGDTGRWLPGRRVLLSPYSVVPGGADHGKLPVNLMKAQIQNSPGVEADEPVSEQRQRELHTYYGWQPYWGVAPYPMAGMLPPAAAVPPAEALVDSPPAETQPRGDPHLRSAHETCGYAIHALDGTLGHIEDLIVHLENWTVPAVVIDTRNWLPGRKVVVSSSVIDRVSWSAREVGVHLDRESIKQSPEYSPDEPLDDDFERRITAYYQEAGVRH